MKKYIIIDDSNLSGYASIVSAGDFIKVYLKFKEGYKVPFGCVYKAYLKNGVNTYYLGIPEFLGDAFLLKKEFHKTYFEGFLSDMPSKIKLVLQSTEKKNFEEKEDEKTNDKEDTNIKTRLSRYLQVFDIFKDEFAQTSWYRVYDVDIVFDGEFDKKVMQNTGVIKSINILKHYLIGVCRDKNILYAIPARYGIDPNPFSGGEVFARWVPIAGQGFRFGNFGYFVISENNLDKAEYFAKSVE